MNKKCKYDFLKDPTTTPFDSATHGLWWACPHAEERITGVSCGNCGDDLFHVFLEI